MLSTDRSRATETFRHVADCTSYPAESSVQSDDSSLTLSSGSSHVSSFANQSSKQYPKHVTFHLVPDL